MRYVKIKDKIINITGKIIKDTYYGLKENEVYIGCFFKQANNLDELINRYVIITKTRNYSYKILTRYQFGNLSRLKLIEGIKEGKIKVFGAIWTDKGLIYVATMNEEGGLKLCSEG